MLPGLLASALRDRTIEAAFFQVFSNDFPHHCRIIDDKNGFAMVSFPYMQLIILA